MIVEIQMIYIHTTKFTKNQSELVFFGLMNCKRLVLGCLVQSHNIWDGPGLVTIYSCLFWRQKTRPNQTFEHYILYHFN